MTKIPLECYLEFDDNHWGIYIIFHDGKKIAVRQINIDGSLFNEMKIYEDAVKARIAEYGKETLAWT